MPKLVWDGSGDKVYETGVDHGVLYPVANNGTYPIGYAWNGLTAVNESPEGAESNPQYADNIEYVNLISTERAKGTIEAFTYPDEFAECDGSAEIAPGVYVGQQSRKAFGMSYRSLVGNDTENEDYGYKLHLVYGAKASPSEKAYNTINDSPEAITFSWEYNATPVSVPGKKPSATITIDSTKFEDDTKLKALEEILYGIDATAFDATKTYAIGDYVTHSDGGTDKTYRCNTAITVPAAWDASKWTEVTGTPGPRLPLPAEVITIMS